MRFSLVLGAAVALPVVVSGAELTGRAALNMVPSVPDTPQAAYAQWRDDNGSLQVTGGFKALQDAIEAHAAAQSKAAMAQMPGQMQDMSGQMAMAQQMQAQYGSPEGQAKLKSMTPAQLMAMAQQMQPARPTMGPVSDHDGALLKKISVYPGIEGSSQAKNQLRTEQVALDEQWQAERQALDDKKRQEAEKLPQCETGEMSYARPDKARDLERKYSDQRLALATRYLGKYRALEQRLRAAVAPEIDWGDSAVQASAQLESVSMKQMMGTQAQGAQTAGIEDAASVAQLVSDASKQAAEEYVARKRIEETYKNAGGCSGHESG